MATHRPQDTASAPDFEFHVAIGVLEASEDLAARRRPVTPQTLARQLRARSFPARPTRTQIERGVAQVQSWRDHVLTRAVLGHRSARPAPHPVVRETAGVRARFGLFGPNAAGSRRPVAKHPDGARR